MKWNEKLFWISEGIIMLVFMLCWLVVPIEIFGPGAIIFLAFVMIPTGFLMMED